MKNLDKWDILHISLTCILSFYYISNLAKKLLTKSIKKPRQKPSKKQRLFENLNLIQRNPMPTPSSSKFLYVICFTGGPCAGKTSTMNHVSKKLFQQGFNVLKIEETPTMIVKGGGNINIGSFNLEESFDFFSNYINFQIEIENIYREMAKNLCKGPTVILCDRGVNDAWAYLSSFETKDLIVSEYYLNMQKMVNTRYDCCLHFVTAADGAEKYYSLDNNVARHENSDLAKKLDKIIQNTYLSHRNLLIIDNFSQNLEEKMEKAYNLIESQIFVDCLKKTKMYEVEITINLPKDLLFIECFISKINLKTENNNIYQRKLKREKYDTFNLFIYSRKNKIDNLKYRSCLSVEEYNEFLKESEGEERTKIRKNFIYENQKLSLKTDTKNHQNYLKILKSESNNPKIPPFLNILREIY